VENKLLNESIVRRVATLSRLSLSDEVVNMYLSQLAVILDHINELSQLDTSGCEPTSHAVSGVKDVFREDVVRPSLSPDEALKNAPKRIGDFFGVPKILE